MMFKQILYPLLKDEQGAELAEYALGVAILVAIAVVVYNTLGSAVNDKNSGTGAQVTTAGDAAFK